MNLGLLHQRSWCTWSCFVSFDFSFGFLWNIFLFWIFVLICIVHSPYQNDISILILMQTKQKKFVRTKEWNSFDFFFLPKQFFEKKWQCFICWNSSIKQNRQLTLSHMCIFLLLCQLQIRKCVNSISRWSWSRSSLFIDIEDLKHSDIQNVRTMTKQNHTLLHFQQTLDEQKFVFWNVVDWLLTSNCEKIHCSPLFSVFDGHTW